MEKQTKLGTILSVEEGAMQDYNKENKSERAVLSFIFASDNSGADDEVLSFLSPLVQTPKTIIINLASLSGSRFSDKLKEAQEKLVGKKTTFTTFVAQISELNDEGHTRVKNDTRTYTNYSQNYLGEFGDEASVKSNLRARLARDIDNGDVEWADD